jgi:hypothetical protein
MPFWPPFLTVDKRFVENTSISTIKLITWLSIQGKALLPDPFGRGYPCLIRSIHRYHTVEGANGRHHHGGDVCGIVVVVVGLKGFSVPYGAGVFHSHPNPNRGIPVKHKPSLSIVFLPQ